MLACDSYEAEQLLVNLVHDLRQPLGNIETGTYVLSILLRDAPAPAREHLGAIERQLDMASSMLSEVAAELRRLKAHRAEMESLDFMKPETADVT